MASDTLFRQKAPGIMALLMQDFALDELSAAAILGNLGHESGGFKDLQEKKPLIPGSRGGWGWAQWTGPRRTEFEAYVERNGFDPSGDTANYKWLFLELKGIVGSEGRAIPAVKNAVGLEAKVKAFELAFERAADEYKHYESRNQWAEKALAAYRAGGWEPLKIGDAAAPEVILPGATKLPTLQTDLNIQALWPLILGVLTMLQKQQQTATGKTPDIMELLTGLLQNGLQPPKSPVPPVAPSAPKSDNALSMLFSILLAAGTATGISTDVLGTPFGTGQTPTTAGSLMTIASIVSPFLSYFGGYGELAKMGLGLLSGLSKMASK